MQGIQESGVRSLLVANEELAYRSAVREAPVICVLKKRRERDECKAYKKAESAVYEQHPEK